jgi:hypothetical protein
VIVITKRPNAVPGLLAGLVNHFRRIDDGEALSSRGFVPRVGGGYQIA